MLFELAVGDAYGAGFEYAPKDFVKKNNTLQNYVQNPKYQTLIPGKYTDDTQMSIAISEVLIEEIEWTPINLANKFVECFKRDQRPGYASGFYDFLQEIKSGREFLEKIRPYSDKSGAAMRSSPIGIISDIEKVKKYSEIQAKITHNTEEGINSAKASALMSHFFIYELGNKKDLGYFIEKHVEGNWYKHWQGEVREKGCMPVQAAITSIVQNNSLSSILKSCVDFCGDVDTVAAIALGAASNCRQVSKDLPVSLVNCLENKIYGKDYLLNLDKKLFSLFKK